MLIEAAHQDALVVREHFFGAIAMMHIEVDNRHALERIFFQGIGRRNRDIVEKAEPHGLARPGMVPGRTNRTKSGAMLAAHDRIDSGNTGAGRCLRSEEHTSELQSLMRTSYAGFCLKKKN